MNADTVISELVEAVEALGGTIEPTDGAPFAIHDHGECLPTQLVLEVLRRSFKVVGYLIRRDLFRSTPSPWLVQ